MKVCLWRLLGRPVLAIALLGIAGCASQPARSPTGDSGQLTDPGFYAGMDESFKPPPGQRSFFEVHDPWGPVNRKLYVFNSYLDNYVLLPAVRVYRFALPDPVRQAVTNFFANLNEVTTFINLALQMKGVEALASAARFFNNTTVGILGLMDAATPMGIPKSMSTRSIRSTSAPSSSSLPASLRYGSRTRFMRKP